MGKGGYLLSFNSYWTHEEQELVETLMTPVIEANGFITLHAVGALKHFTTEPSQAPTFADLQRRGPWIDVGDAMTLVSGCYGNTYSSEVAYVYWCDEDADVLVVVHAGRDFHDEIERRVDVRLESG